MEDRFKAKEEELLDLQLEYWKREKKINELSAKMTPYLIGWCILMIIIGFYCLYILYERKNSSLPAAKQTNYQPILTPPIATAGLTIFNDKAFIYIIMKNTSSEKLIKTLETYVKGSDGKEQLVDVLYVDLEPYQEKDKDIVKDLSEIKVSQPLRAEARWK